MKSFRLLVIFVSLLLFSFTAKPQSGVAEFLQGNLEDAKTLGHAYLEPFGTTFGTSLNGGWYQAARPHKMLGFNVTFVTSIATVPNNAKSFNVGDLSLNNLELEKPSDNMTPTIAGDNTHGPTLLFKDDPSGSLGFELPKGANLFFTPVTMMQAGIGLPYSTEITVRFLPPLSIPKLGRVSLWGVGAKNEFKDFIPGLKLVPIDLSLMVGYTNFTSEFEVNFRPEVNDLDPNSDYAMSDFNNQRLALDASGFTARLLVGKTIPLLSVYAGFGYSHAKTEFGLKGNYALGLDKPYTDEDIIADPFVLEFPVSNFSANAGFRVRLGVISLNFDYTLGDYALYSAGIGISFR